VIPSGQSMVADYYPEHRRGAAFGALYLTGAVGAMLGEKASRLLCSLPATDLCRKGSIPHPVSDRGFLKGVAYK
jgi:hypothetical protein